MSDLVQVFRGSVNRWECDENDHLNVRFYAHKMYQTVQAGLVSAGLIPPDHVDIDEQIRSVHMRYIAEARIAAPITGCFGVVEQTPDHLKVVAELRNTSSHTLMASYVFELAMSSTTTVATIPMPEGSGSRGLPATPSAFSNLDLSTALERGFIKTGQGVVQAEECDPSGRLLFYQYIGRVSDAVPNLWAVLEGESARGEGMLGGAVLEYRTDKLGSLCLGSQFTLLSGFTGMGEKTKHLAHLMFSNETGICVAASEVIAINMDLVARKAIAIPAAERDILKRLLIKPMD